MELKEEIRECEICGSTEYTIINKKEPWSRTHLIKQKNKFFHITDVMCGNCGLLYKNPMLTKESLCEFYKDAYMKLYEPVNVSSISSPSIAERVITTVYCLDWLDSIGYDLIDKKVFEVGCGFGTLLMGMNSLGAEISGIEIGERSYEIGKKIFGFESIKGSFEEMCVTECWDLVIINNTLEHFHSPTDVLNKAKSMLSPDGRILIEVPSLRYPYPGITIDAFLSSAHNFTYSQESFEYLANKCGLVIEHMSYAGHRKCMFFLLSRGEEGGRHTSLESGTIERLVARYKEHDKFFDVTSDSQAFSKKMQENKYLELAKEYPNHKNILLIHHLNGLLSQGKATEVLDVLGNPNSVWKHNESEDINLCSATTYYIAGLAYRYLGDFVSGKKCLEYAMLLYPHFDKYNFINDMIINGLISDDVFTDYSWCNCKKTLEMM